MSNCVVGCPVMCCKSAGMVFTRITKTFIVYHVTMSAVSLIRLLPRPESVCRPATDVARAATELIGQAPRGSVRWPVLRLPAQSAGRGETASFASTADAVCTQPEGCASPLRSLVLPTACLDAAI